MTRKRVDDAEYVQFRRRADELVRRVTEGSLPVDRVMDGLQDLIEGRFAVGELKFPVWKTIKLGTGLKTADDFRQALKAYGFKIGDWASDILGKPAFTVAAKETEVELVKVLVRDLGFQNGAVQKDIYRKAQELGLGLCPNEVGPQLRLQYKDQPLGEWLRIAMEPISDSVGFLFAFNVVYDDDGLWLRGGGGRPAGFWDAVGQFVFVRRK